MAKLTSPSTNNMLGTMWSQLGMSWKYAANL